MNYRWNSLSPNKRAPLSPTKPSLYPHLTVHAAFIGRLQLQGCDGAAAAAMAAGRGRCGWIWMAAPRSGHGCGPAAPEWRESLLAKIPAQEDEPCPEDLAALEEALFPRLRDRHAHRP